MFQLVCFHFDFGWLGMAVITVACGCQHGCCVSVIVLVAVLLHMTGSVSVGESHMIGVWMGWCCLPWCCLMAGMGEGLPCMACCCHL